MILVIYGTRPEAVKLKVCVDAARAKGLPVTVWNTNQSPDLNVEDFLPADFTGPLSWPHITAQITPKLVVAQGDTRTCFQAAVMAYENGVPFFHVEAGVRTGDIHSPWPEEGYRQMISRIATYHACTTDHAIWNVAGEGFGWARRTVRDGEEGTVCDDRYVRVTGSPVVDAMLSHPPYEPISTTPYALITLHRRENQPHFANILRGIVDAIPLDIWPMWYAHPNQWAVEALPSDLTPTLHPRHPVDALTFANALRGAEIVITDSGGCQEEGQVVRTPIVVCRTVTDRPENIGKGAFLGGVTREGVASAIKEALAFDRYTMDPWIFGDGKSADRISDWWSEILGTP